MNSSAHPSQPASACCGNKTAAERAAHSPMQAHPPHVGAHAGHGSGWRGAAQVTLHCLTGCAIGELAGLSIGVGLGWVPNASIALAVVLSFFSGYALTLIPLLRRGMNFRSAFATVWLGELISIAAMELVMNAVDYGMGGMRGSSLASGRYWISFLAAGIAGFIAAWPVNRWMLSRDMKRCH